MLDAAASAAADMASDLAAERWEYEQGHSDKLMRPSVLAYSPGYCGWHVSGQRKLFERLRPEEIGITLNASFLMSPLKSVSGALVCAEPEAHSLAFESEGFEERFECCDACRDRSCRERISRLLG